MTAILKLEDLGYNDKLEAFRIEQKLDHYEIGRVIAEHKERYIVKSTKGEFEAEITGNMRFTAKSREDFFQRCIFASITTKNNNVYSRTNQNGSR